MNDDDVNKWPRFVVVDENDKIDRYSTEVMQSAQQMFRVAESAASYDEARRVALTWLHERYVQIHTDKDGEVTKLGPAQLREIKEQARLVADVLFGQERSS